jgi:hypothetical protein
MKAWKLAVPTLALAACVWLPAPTAAAASSGSLTFLVHGSCLAAGAPSPLLFTGIEVAAASHVCGACSQAACVGKDVNSLCDGHLLCQQTSVCSTGAPQCECASPP